jgi:hypothetical protein
MPDSRETAEFRIVGRVMEVPQLMTSASGTTQYCKPKIKVKAGPKGYERGWFLIAFGGIAQEFVRDALLGATVEATGDLQVGKNKVTGSWDTSYILRGFTLLAAAPETEDIAESFGVAADDITF